MENARTNGVAWRYERKFLVSELAAPEVESIVRLHPAGFAEAYPPRQVNNCYLDLPGLRYYQDSIDGRSDRQKMRIRWYAELTGSITGPVLEIKIKRGHLGRKERIPLERFEVENPPSAEVFLDVLHSTEVSHPLRTQLRSLRATLINRYRRKYFVSADGNYRITIDENTEYYTVPRFTCPCLRKASDRLHTIVELKYGKESASDVRFIANYLPFRVTRSSKYVSGIQELSLS